MDAQKHMKSTNHDLLSKGSDDADSVLIQQHRNETKIRELDAKFKKQNADINELAQQNAELRQMIKDLKAENKYTRREMNTQACDTNKTEHFLGQKQKKLEVDLDETKMRHNKLTVEDPDMACLSETNSPTKIAEMYTELYGNEWVDAYMEFERLVNEKTIIWYLLSILKLTKKQCDIISERNIEDITKAVYFAQKMPSSVPREVKKQIRYIRKTAAPLTTNQILQEVEKYLDYKLRDSELLVAINTKTVQAYIKKCTDICWFMVVQDPPLYFGPDVKENDVFDKSRFKEYTRSGSRVEYLVWPDLYLKEGSRLCKGVAQGFGGQTEKKKSARVRPESAPAASQAHVSSPRDIKPTDRLMDHQIMRTRYQTNAENTNRMLSGHDNENEQITANSQHTGIDPNLSRFVYVPSGTTEHQEEKVAVKIRRADVYKNVPRGVPLEYWVNFVYDCDVYGIESSITKATAGQYYRDCVKHYQNVRYLAAIK